MPDFPITDEAVEAAAKAISPQMGYAGTPELMKDVARAAIEAFLRAEGFEVEWLNPNKKPASACRLVGRWSDGWTGGPDA